MMGAQLRITSVMCDLAAEFKPTLTEAEASEPAQIEGEQQFRSGAATVISGALQTLSETHVYRTSELRRFIGYMKSTLPVLFREIPDGSRTEFLIRIRLLPGGPKMQDLKPGLEELVEAVNKPSGKGI